jgi:hypothetical protein
MTISLEFASTSTRNTTISCDSLGLHYELSDEDGTTTLKKWDSGKNENALIAQFQIPRLSSDKIKFPDDSDWQGLTTFMGKPSSNPFATYVSFFSSLIPLSDCVTARERLPEPTEPSIGGPPNCAALWYARLLSGPNDIILTILKIF